MATKSKAKPVTRTALRKLLAQLPESELVAAHRYLCYLRDQGSPVLQAFLNAPLDDEPLTEEDVKAIEESKEDIKSGRVYTLKQVKKELGL